MEAVKKFWFWGIFISILSIFAMSHNVVATDLLLNLNDYDSIFYSQNPDVTCDGTLSNDRYCYTTSNSGVGIRLNNSISLLKGDIISVYLYINGNSVSDVFAIFNNASPYNPTWYDLLDVTIVDSNYEENTNIDLIQHFGDRYTITQSGEANLYVRGDWNEYIVTNNNKFSILVRYTFRYIRNDNQVNAFGFNPPFQIVNGSNTGTIKYRFMYFHQWRYSGSQENKEQQQKTQEAADASEDAGGDSSSDAQTGTTSLINAITGAVTVISSASPTNCKINGNMGNLDMGQLDLCANPAPAFVTTIGSLILILMCVPLAITLFNRFISLFRSFQS